MQSILKKHGLEFQEQEYKHVFSIPEKKIMQVLQYLIIIYIHWYATSI